MLELLTVGASILLVDVANPVLLAAVVLAVSQPKPVASALALITGHTVTYLLIGILIVYGLAEWLAKVAAPLIERFNSPQLIDYVISFVVGVALLVVALRWKTDPPKPSENPPAPANEGLLAAFLFGSVINFIGIPFALPYFAFVAELLAAPASAHLPGIIIYNLGYALPFALIPLAVAVFGEAAMPVLEKINDFVERYSVYIMPGILMLLGLFLIADAGLYFSTGTGLI